MKKVTCVLLCIALAIALPSAAALTVDDFEYKTKEDGTAALTRYLGAAAEPEIPAAPGDLPLTLIGEGAFRDCGFLKEAVIPDTVTIIGTLAFYNCAALEAVVFPANLAEIGDLAFAYCVGLRDIKLPEGTGSIGEFAFGECVNLKRADIPPDVTVIAPDAFQGTAAGFTIRGDPGSFAQAYAGQAGFTFEEISFTPLPENSGASGEAQPEIPPEQAPPKADAARVENAAEAEIPAEAENAAQTEDTMAPEVPFRATLTLRLPHADQTGAYTGETRDGFAHGQGSFACAGTDSDGWNYEGAFEHGAMSGYGTVTWPDGHRFRGTMRGNQPLEGEWLSGGESVYSGGFAMLQDSGLFVFQGKGKLSNRLGKAFYEGAFASGFLEETARERLARIQKLEPQCALLTGGDYAALMGSPEAFAGKQVELTGVVDSVVKDPKQGETEFILRSNRDKGTPVRVLYRYGAEEERVKAGMALTLWGTVCGIHGVPGGKGAAAQMPDVDAEGLILTPVNQQRGAAPAALKLTHELEGGNLEDHTFTFILSHLIDESEAQAAPDTGVQTEHLQEKAGAVSGKIAFDPIAYAAGDIGRFYTYVITQVPGSERGMTYDPASITVTVFVADGGGVPVPKVFYPETTVFINRYKASGSVSLEAAATLKGRELREGEFSFDLKLGKELLQTKANGPDGAIAFDPILYTQDDIGKTYSYKINEVRGKEKGILYPTEPKTVKVIVSDAGNGSLSAAVTYPKEMAFINSYKAAGKAALFFRTELQNRALKEKEFTFALKLDGETLQKKTNDAAGEIAFKQIPYTQKDIGKTYVYEIAQIPGKEAGMVYDPLVKTASVSVSDSGNGILEAEVSYLTDTLFVNRLDPSSDPTLLNGDWNLNLTITGYTPEDLETNVRIGESFDLKWVLDMETEGYGTVTTDKGSFSATFLNGEFKASLESENTIYLYKGMLDTKNGVMTITGEYVETHPGHIIYTDMALTREK